MKPAVPTCLSIAWYKLLAVSAHPFGPFGGKGARIAGMKRRTLLRSLPTVALLPTAAWVTPSLEKPGPQEKALPGQSSTAVYELRVYHTYEGKLDDLLRRFREHTMRLFEKHGIKNVAYWTPLDDPLKGQTLIYLLAHPNRDAATANWKAFREDPEWLSARDKSEANGKLVEKVDFTFLALTDFSPQLR
jgi:NIPSNAP protein